MQFQWSHFIDVAIFLFSNADDTTIPREAAYRSAISRAYYAAFCHAKWHAKDNFLFEPADNEEDHRDLRDHLKDHGKKDIARYLTQLRQWRNESDYDDPAYNATSQKVQSAISLAEKVVSTLK
ncbi:HEPN domain-containing protein [Methanoculleus sp. FWC-SCC1]|uniref:HEPN domain-containing protein n=1 Tax=Methanoculleus frigidifontis TaxID=2584085 RepID=A0ABT8M7W6_9EURY|nr:HEPN domain-containing protein [Methanoculleus sp. FWC-SCC1]